MPGPADIPEIDAVVLEMPVGERPVRREGRRRDDRQLADPGDRQRHLRRDRRPITDLPITPEKVLRALESRNSEEAA